jgi:polyhydroxybutyrate depolymerase
MQLKNLILISWVVSFSIFAKENKPAYHKPGVFKVKSLEYSNLKDRKRNNRSVPIKVIYPDAPGPYPLVVMSHGGMGTWDSLLYQAEHIASHGFVVLCPEHVYSNNVRVKQHMRHYMSKEGGGMGFKKAIQQAIHQIIIDPKSVLERPRDVSFAIDQAIEWNKMDPELKGKINLTKIGMIGHSYGAYTTLVVCGARPILDQLEPKVKPGKGLAEDLSDKRITFGLAISPQGPDFLRFSRDSYKTINRPIICMSGSKDLQKGKDVEETLPAEFRLEAFRLIPAGQKYFLWLENADHFSFVDNPKAWIFPSRARADTKRITKAAMVIACGMFLKDSKQASRFFNHEYFNSLCGKTVTKITWMEKSEDIDALLKGDASGVSVSKKLLHNGLKRTYRIYIPPVFSKAKSMPMVIALHGGGGTGERMEDLTLEKFNRLADKEGFFVVYPDGIERHWNDGRKEVKYSAHKKNIDDVGFISALIDSLAKEFNIDTKRVYVTGMSNGAMMSHRLGCELSDKIAAIAPVAGSLPKAISDLKPSRPVPTLIINNTKDPMIAWEGGDAHFRRLKCGKVLSTESTVKFWTRNNKCLSKPVITKLPDIVPEDGTRLLLELYSPSKDGAEVVLYVVEGGGHTWPSGYQYLGEWIIGKTSKDIDACKVIWDFFQRNKLQSQKDVTF